MKTYKIIIIVKLIQGLKEILLIKSLGNYKKLRKISSSFSKKFLPIATGILIQKK